MVYLAKDKEDGGESESAQAASPFLNPMPCEWNPKFMTRRDLDYSTENKPYIEARAELGVEDNVETRAELGEEESVVRTFMRGPDESDVCLPQADKVEAFCFGANLESLKVEAGKVSETPVAWLDERSFATGKGHSRTYRGPLTARDLYKELKKPVRYLILTPFQKNHESSCDSMYTSASAVLDPAIRSVALVAGAWQLPEIRQISI
jgi:hypothetical protein